MIVTKPKAHSKIVNSKICQQIGVDKIADGVKMGLK